MKTVITVIGKDRPGIIYQVSKVLFEEGLNIEDISQTVMQDYFTMIMIASGSDSINIRDLNERLDALEGDTLSIRLQKTDIFDSMHNI
ncbi:MAG: ACT domain-containing protein [Eubacteriaceae bacterium]|nr:ACT domain-containing protein [Eubacteriaceae bacterium]